ncbi:phage antirepressor [Commensalibacter communis]|uniref:phage antirepressor n=1 Tax=Commensalibacter communis TaxID=2972786 RepID=UPI0022FFAF94|nr:phage antirepressor [Commensalibacter communis]CAI3933247.1 Prophage antirepressor [Commensalibacter communis]CAI3944946.1 Prophage antirepressor [Commensalibacter communis]
MSNIIPFNFENTEVRIIHENEEVLFCLKDVCEVLTISNHRRVLADILDEKGVRKTYTLTAGGRQELAFINEPNLYRVIFRSNKAKAKHFQDWVFNDVLPSIRKTGGYMATIPDETPEQTLSRALLLAKNTMDRQTQEISQLKPKADGYDRLASSDGSMCITDAAKDLQIRPKELFDFLKTNGWIYRRAGGKNWIAYQDKIQQGVLEHKVSQIFTNDGESKIREQVLVTPKGLAKLAKIFSTEQA